MKYIFVDVDGVLNFDIPNDYSIDKFADLGGSSGYDLRLDSRHGEWLTKLAVQTNSTLVWGTTWQGLANRYIGPAIELPELPVAVFPNEKRYQTNYPLWKTTGVKQFAGDSYGIWFDDDAQMLRPYMHDSNVQLIEVDYRVGLRMKEIDLARKILLDMPS